LTFGESVSDFITGPCEGQSPRRTWRALSLRLLFSHTLIADKRRLLGLQSANFLSGVYSLKPNFHK
jgi:hypothetical protein